MAGFGVAVVLMLAAAPTMAAMVWTKRVLVVAAPDARDAGLRSQRAMMAAMAAEAGARDLVVVEIVGDSVSGAADGAAALRRAYGLPADRFGAVLVGKDGGVKLRAGAPVSGERLMALIDAMPMRRSGGN